MPPYPSRSDPYFFGKNPQQFLSQATIHCGLFGPDEISVLDDRMVQGTVIDQVNDAMEFIRKNIRVAFVMTGEPERKQVWDYPVEALREAVINAVCHRDYTISSSVEIRILEDSLRVWSPGRLAFFVGLPGGAVRYCECYQCQGYRIHLWQSAHPLPVRKGGVPPPRYPKGYPLPRDHGGTPTQVTMGGPPFTCHDRVPPSFRVEGGACPALLGGGGTPTFASPVNDQYPRHSTQRDPQSSKIFPLI
jgi:hypothetical protein